MELFTTILRRINKQQNALVAIIIGGFMAVVGLSLYQSYKKQMAIYLDEKENYLSAIVSSSVGFIDGDQYEKLLALDKKALKKNSYYHQTKEILKRIQRQNHLKTEVYTLSRLPQQGQALFLIVNSGDSIWFKNPYSAPEKLYDLFETGGRLGPYDDEHGTWISSCVPILNSKGVVVGSLQADVNFKEFEMVVKHSIYQASYSAAIPFIIILFLLVLITRLKVSQITKLQQNFFGISDELNRRNMELLDAHGLIESRNVELLVANAKLEEGIKERTVQLEDKNKELNTFFYHASHRMKTPVVNILGLVELAKLAPHEPGMIGHLDKIGKLSRRTIRLLDQLNKASYSNLGDEKAIELCSFFESCIKDHSLRSCVDVRIDAKSGWSFTTNPYLLQVIFDAILENAIFFSAKTARQHPLVNIACMVDENGLRVSVTDNGCGIHQDQMGSIFNMFFIGNPVSKGSGLGLYLANLAVEKLGGKIQVESVEHEFTRISVALPHRSDVIARQIF